jgi:hypothetical protein
VSELNEDLDLYSYWTFTDVFEEGGLPLVEFKNIYGTPNTVAYLLAHIYNIVIAGIMTIHGIPKPAWRAFQLLHSHAGDMRLGTAVTNSAPSPHPSAVSGDTPCTGCQGKSAGYCKDDTGVCYPYASPGVCPPGMKKCTASTPTPPPTPAPSNTTAQMISAFSTANSTTGTVAVFVSFWGNPDPTQPVPANRTVTVYLHFATAAAPTSATLHMINGNTDPRVLWEDMGRPSPQDGSGPDSTQMAALLARSQVVSLPATQVSANATTMAVTLEVSQNSAVVVTFA